MIPPLPPRQRVVTAVLAARTLNLPVMLFSNGFTVPPRQRPVDRMTVVQYCLRLERAGILPNEQVDVLNINNGNRFTTYAIPAPAGSGMIGINGAAARLAQKDDLVIVIALVILPLLVIQPGQTLDYDGELPLQVVLGRTSGVDVIVRGQVFDTSAYAPNKVARFEVK